MPRVFYAHILEGILGEWTDFLACHHPPVPDTLGPSPGSPESEKAAESVIAPRIDENAGIAA